MSAPSPMAVLVNERKSREITPVSTTFEKSKFDAEVFNFPSSNDNASRHGPSYTGQAFADSWNASIDPNVNSPHIKKKTAFRLVIIIRFLLKKSRCYIGTCQWKVT